MKKNLSDARNNLYSSNLKNMNKNLSEFISAKHQDAESRARRQDQDRPESY